MATPTESKTQKRRLSETLDIEWPEEERKYLTGNHALAEAAIRAGCRFYAGYPITPSTEILEYMSKRLRGSTEEMRQLGVKREDIREIGSTLNLQEIKFKN